MSSSGPKCQSSVQVPHNRLTYGAAEKAAVAAVVASGYWAGGSRQGQLEQALARRAGVLHAVGVASGLAALRLALKGLQVGPGDEVLVPAYSCVALANAVLALGATPVPVDIRRSDWNLSPASASQAVTDRTKAVIAVNTFGVPAPVAALSRLGLPVIEDCAHGFGLRVGRQNLGGRADVAVLSFYATKLLGGGEGGAVLTRNEPLAAFVREWRDYGDAPPDGLRLNDKMNDLEAALALCQLRRLVRMIAARSKAASRYNEWLRFQGTSPAPYRLPDISSVRVWYRYVVEFTAAPAGELVDALQQRGVGAAIPVTDWRSQDMARCPVADHAFAHLVSLPLYPTLKVSEQVKVARAFHEIVRKVCHE